MSSLTDKELAHILQESMRDLREKTGSVNSRDLAKMLVDTFELTFKVEPGDASEDYLPIKGQTLRWGDLSHNSEFPSVKGSDRVITNIEQANTVNSDLIEQRYPEETQAHGYGPQHNVVFDIDHPVSVIESSEGKSHLYIDRPMSWSTLVMLMAAFVEAGLMEPGYMYASIERGYTSVRVPWALKGSGHHVPEPPQPDARIVKSFDDLDF